MISTMNVLQGLAGKVKADGTDAAASGEGFLDALLTTLPPEAQGLSLQELIEWLREQGDGAAVGLVLPQVVDETIPPGLQAEQDDPAEMVNWIMSSRQNMTAPVNVEVAADDVAFSHVAQSVTVEDEALLEADGMLRVPVRHPEFGQAVGERLVWMVRHESQEARIRLDPPSLGPLEISVSVKDDQASVMIHANHAVTRELLEAEVPRLRAMLGEQGFAQTDVNVARDDSAQQQGEDRPAGDAAPVAAAGDSSEELSTDTATRVKVGLVDQYV